MTIHTSHPFADSEPDPARRLRGRLGGAVTLWTAGEGTSRVGLTVSSAMIALGPQPAILALLDPDSELLAEIDDGGRVVVQLLEWHHRHLAEAFAGTAPAPGGPFRQADFTQSDYGPRLTDATTWADATSVETREIGWSVEITASLDHVVLGEEADPLLHRRGRFRRPGT